MKKTIFKGTINGQEFNSVQEYNKAMMKALTAGEPVDAQASTKTVDDDCDCDCDCKQKVEYIPYFDSTGKEYHLTITDLLDESADLDKLLDEVKQNLNNKFELIDKITDKWDAEGLIQYGEELDIALNMLNENIKAQGYAHDNVSRRSLELKKQIEDLSKELKSNSNRLEYLNKSGKVLEELDLFYEAVKDIIDEKYHKADKRPVAKAPQTKTAVKEPQKEYNFNEKELTEFLKSIFGF